MCMHTFLSNTNSFLTIRGVTDWIKINQKTKSVKKSGKKSYIQNIFGEKEPVCSRQMYQQNLRKTNDH